MTMSTFGASAANSAVGTRAAHTERSHRIGISAYVTQGGARICVLTLGFGIQPLPGKNHSVPRRGCIPKPRVSAAPPWETEPFAMRLSIRYRLLLPLALLLLGDAAATAWAAANAARRAEERLAAQQWAVARTLTEPRSTF